MLCMSSDSCHQEEYQQDKNEVSQSFTLLTLPSSVSLP